MCLPPGSLTAASAVIPLEQNPPSVEHFLVHYMLPPGGPKPVVLRGVMEGWPALTKWKDLDYLSQVGWVNNKRVTAAACWQHVGSNSSISMLAAAANVGNSSSSMLALRGRKIEFLCSAAPTPGGMLCCRAVTCAVLCLCCVV